MQVVQVTTQDRTDLGKKATKALRQSGSIPAVVYSKDGVTHFSTTHGAVKKLIYTPDFKMAELQLAGGTKKALIKDIDFHPVTDAIMHIDFIELIPNHPVKASIPVKFKGVSPGVKAGGKLISGLRTVKVKATPETLVDELFVDISTLELSEAVRVKDLEVPEGLNIEVDPAIPIAIVEVPRALKGGDGDDETDGADEAGADSGDGTDTPAEG